MEVLGIAPGYLGFHGVPDPVRRVRWLSLPLEAIGAAHLVERGPDVVERADRCARLVLFGTQTGQIHTHLFPTGYLFTSWVGSIPGPLSDGVRDLFAVHGSMERPLIVSASANGIVVRTSTGVPVHVLISPEWSQSRLCRPIPLSGHAMLLVVTDLGRMHLLHAERGIALRSSVDPPHVRRVLAADWLRNDAVVLGHDDGTISIRDSSQLRVLQAEPTRKLSGAPRLPVVDLAVLPESGYVAAVYGVVPLVRIYDIRKGLDGISGGCKQSPAIVQELDVPSADAVIALKWHPQSGSLFTLGVGGNLERFQIRGDAAAAPVREWHDPAGSQRPLFEPRHLQRRRSACSRRHWWLCQGTGAPSIGSICS
ncbi:poly(A)-specific ribonuclease [Cyanidiococcus yangmingshanensis]|uniref:Poly(A)-specific ribonuclease n=1 Tax=Cyanidiococcus yangmingshanensis TaxID=2690220 RepID=A0A7J7IMW9_9RHOD|nr:poly(A)-specific ribonuclease [Cyanidiococcus yangmingshanensis]